ncbi:MAG: hypothetical protein LBR79_02570, partial [Oscillospiraceae bacterium]|nr:hypothetical protein [Oscillospiraceae bacterium]
KLENETGNNNSTGSSGSSVGSSSATDNFPLKKGSKGTRTTNLQRICNYHNTIPYLPLVEDGIWGDKTEAAMMRLFGINSVNEKQYTEILQTVNVLSFTSIPSTAFTNKLKSLA